MRAVSPAPTSNLGAELAEHLVALPGGDWSLWSWMCVRAAGFEASFVLRLADAESARLIDSLLDEEVEEGRARALALERVAQLLDRTAEVEARAPLQKTAKRLNKRQVPEPTGIDDIDVAIAALAASRGRAEAARAQLPRTFDAASARAATALREAAEDGRFREALTWQNRSAIESCLAVLLRHTGTRNWKQRQREKLVASYLQRYCTKNDTIGFFGPVGWGRFSRSGETLVLKPGAGLVDHRSVHLEQWAVDALAAAIAQDPRIEPFMAPRLYSFVTIDGERVHSAVNGRHALPPEQRALLAACDGTRSALEVAARLAPEYPEAFASRAAVFEALRTLREKKLVAWTLEVPLKWNPELTLRRLLEQVGDDDARNQALTSLGELEQARDAVAASAGDAAALETSLAAMESTFTRLTGAAPTRHSGSMYAARGLLFEDCRRDLEVEIGPRILEDIGPALTLLLTSARWLTFEVARVYREAFRKIHADVSKRVGASAVPFADAWFRMQRVLFGAKERPIEGIVASLQQRWADILSLPADGQRARFTSEELRAKVAAAFEAPGPGWHEARHHSPDLMIAAASADAIRRGEYEAILGEMHVGLNTMASALFVAQHPRPEELEQAMQSDIPEPRVAFVLSKDWPKVTLRTTAVLVSPKDYSLETGFDTAGPPRDRILRMSDLVIDDVDGSLVVRSHDGSVSADLIDFLSHQLSFLVLSSYKMLAHAKHSPRVTIDRLVVSRESWSFACSDLAFADEESELDQFAGARRWARLHGLPRFVYAKATIEVKPIYVDLESPIFVAIFARLIRRVKEDVAGEKSIAVAEMLPGMDQLWLPGPRGEVYTSELRLVARDATASASPTGAAREWRLGAQRPPEPTPK